MRHKPRSPSSTSSLILEDDPLIALDLAAIVEAQGCEVLGSFASVASEWDTAAGDHVLTCAGGGVIGPGGAPLTYGHEDRGYRNPPFAALGDLTLAKRLSLPAVAA